MTKLRNDCREFFIDSYVRVSNCEIRKEKRWKNIEGNEQDGITPRWAKMGNEREKKVEKRSSRFSEIDL